jgi:orotidine-5'-phosphate decarboxylase
MSESKIIVALDMESIDKALKCLSSLDPKRCRIKIGKEMFVGFGPEWVRTIINMGFEVFLDLKFHDIPNTVYKACVQAAELGVWMVNVHALGGLSMLKKAREAIDSVSGTTSGSVSSSDSGMQKKVPVGLHGTVEENVLRLAKLCADANLDGVVCSAWEANKIKASVNKDNFLCVTPGIRFESSNDDQKRIMTPKAALDNGADYLVIGRSITQAENPQKVLEAILNGI